MANFVEILRNMLSKCPPRAPSAAAVDLLVATANLQRFLRDTHLYQSRHHPGHLDAMELWRPHVISWIESSKQALCGQCAELEKESKLTVAQLARVDVAKMPGMIEGIEGAVAPLVLMVMVPSMEEIISNWCAHSTDPPASQKPPASNDSEYSDDLAAPIGAQFDQAVKELRTGYADGVASCASRLANHALQAALDPRVFMATGRALWDCVGKDLYDFVHSLQESNDNKGAWRLRQHATVALKELNDFFRNRLAAFVDHRISERDLDLPVHVSKAARLLEKNTAVVNIAHNPF
ncbi:hypothetical protein GPECTOR_50g636 [Gonium pectorale]|uniref:Uncharacterized protein n=1 Tax=Gonium pectorale TaxID=33097 RepID=A0A150G7L7_GONPE|nr:hypothetical protein GPECTOR_50g636 [Gonium pectorale]|eukprot:KXZ45842.1 hypothetical protein GPECTOR_50g636 [Gonium pectorale]